MTAAAGRSLGRSVAMNSPFALDLRAIGLFRVLLALTILWDQAIRLGGWEAFHSALGVVSLGDSRAWNHPWDWSLYWLSDGPLLPYLLEALRALATVFLLVGIRSRLSAFVLFVLLSSVAARNPLLLQGGDRVLVVMTFFACFLPLGRWGSLENLWFGGETERTCRSAGTVAYVVQVLLVWFMAGILKTGEQWWDTGTAISMALHLEAFTSEFARLWRGWDWFLQPLTLFVFWIECLAPLAAIVPVYWCRIAGLLALVALEIGIWASLEVGLFPIISLVSLVPLCPSRLIDSVVRRRRGRRDRRGSDLVLFYDRDCRFCLFACRLLLAVCGIRGAHLQTAQSDGRAARILEDSFAWSVAVAGNPGSADTCGGLDPNYRQGWGAVRFLVQESPRRWLLRLLPGAALGDRSYAWIGRNRGKIGAAGRIVFGTKAPRGHGEIGRFAVSSALVLVLAWNLATYPAIREWRDLRPLVEPLIFLFHLDQYWGMFAPHPYSFDFWHVAPALGRDGSRVDLLSGQPVSMEPPEDGPERYGGYRWRKTILRSLQRNEIERVFGYFCRTGRWQAFDLWELSRENLGVAATADLPYGVLRVGRWQCGAADMGEVGRFRAEVDARMEEYRQSNS